MRREDEIEDEIEEPPLKQQKLSSSPPSLSPSLSPSPENNLNNNSTNNFILNELNKKNIELWTQKWKLLYRIQSTRGIQAHRWAHHYLVNDQFDKAIKQFKIAIKNDCYNTEYHEDFANAFISMGKYDKAVKYFNNVLQIDTECERLFACGNIYFQIGEKLFSIGKFEEAIKFLLISIDNGGDDENEGAEILLSLAYEILDRNDEAEYELELIFDNEEKYRIFPAAYLLLSLIYIKIGKYEHGIRYGKFSINVVFDPSDIIINKIMVKIKARFDEVVKMKLENENKCENDLLHLQTRKDLEDLLIKTNKFANLKIE